jgi:hypothetical protein
VARTQCGSIIAAGASVSTIQTALNSCASAHPLTTSSPGDGGYVLLGTGTFNLTGTVNVPSNVTLRGMGADQTILQSGSDPMIGIGTNDPSHNAVSINSGGTAGSTSIVVSSASDFSVGKYIHISELNDPAYVSNIGSGGTNTWCDAWYNCTRAKGQIVEITGVSGTTITFTPALYSGYTHTPQAFAFDANAKYAGLEALQIYGTNASSGSYSIDMEACAYCWIKGIEENTANYDADSVEVMFGYRDEIRDNYFTSAYVHTTGGSENELKLAYKTSGVLIENNIFERKQTSVNIARGSAGNVIAYNFVTGSFDSTDPTLGSMGAFYFHEAHSQFNLIEGNIVPSLYPDSVWGTNSNQTFFRNWATGVNKGCAPFSGRGTVNCTGNNGSWPSKGVVGFRVDALSTYDNFVGNIVGSADQNALALTKVASVVYPSSCGWDTQTCGWQWGSTTLSGGGSGSSANSYNTAFRHGNYTLFDGSLIWDANTTQTLPASFYKTAKPSWWGSLGWPSIGPDVNGGTGPGGHTALTSANPAQNCFYNVMGGTEGGAGGPYAFNADTCYKGSSSGAIPAAPNGLSATAQ